MICLRSAILLVGLLLPQSASAEELEDANRRRVATLRSLVHGEPVSSLSSDGPPPGVLAKPFPRPQDPAFRCLDDPWWQESRAALRMRTLRAVRDASLRYGIDRQLILAVIRHESGFDPRALSPAGAMGLMQLMPETARELDVMCPEDPRENVLAGTRYLAALYDRFGSWPDAVAAYNAGPRSVERGRFPSETRTYVRRVLRTWKPLRYPRVVLSR